MVVVHVILVAVVVERNVGFTVMRRVDVDLALEDMCGRVGRVDVGDQWLVRHDQAGFLGDSRSNLARLSVSSRHRKSTFLRMKKELELAVYPHAFETCLGLSK